MILVFRLKFCVRLPEWRRRALWVQGVQCLWLFGEEADIDEGGLGRKDGLGAVDCDVKEDVACGDHAVGRQAKKQRGDAFEGLRRDGQCEAV